MDFIVRLLNSVIELYSMALIIYILMSWFPSARGTAIGQFLTRICEPYLEQFRRFIPPIGMIDFSPIVALLVLRLAKYGVAQLFSWIS